MLNQSNVFISIGKVEMNCPLCGWEINGINHVEPLHHSKRGYLYIKCPCCTESIGITADYRGDMVAFKREKKMK